MIIRLMRFCRWIGHSGISAVMAEQLGTAMMPLWSRMRRPLISGTTSGTFLSMRKAEELSITTAPAFTAIGENFLETPLPAENSTMSTPWKESSRSSSIPIVSPRKPSVLPADRELASAFSFLTGKRRLSRVAMNSAPTAPVTPAMATTGSLCTFVSLWILGNKKAPDHLARGFGSDDASFDYARTPPEPRGSLVLVVVLLAAKVMGGDLWARLGDWSIVFTRKSPNWRLNGTP